LKRKNYYRVLGVTATAGRNDIRNAYRKKAREFHPDVSKADDAEERFKDINEAWEVLSDKAKRREYDRIGELDEKQRDAAFSDYYLRLFGEDGFAEEADMMDLNLDSLSLDDIVAADENKVDGAWSNDLAPLHETLWLTLEEAHAGGEREVAYKQPMQRPSSQTVFHNKTLSVNVPPRSLPGHTIRVRGQGVISFDGRAGDLVWTIRIKKHPMFTLKGRDLYLTVPVTPWEMVLGGHIRIPTLTGDVRVAIPPCSVPNQHLRLRGRGLSGGDHFLVFKVMTPPKISTQEKGAYARLAKVSAFNPRKHWK